MREQWVLSQGQDCQWYGEENRENLKRNELWECLVDVASVAELHSKVLDWDPEGDATRDNIVITIVDCSSLDSMHLAHDHEEDVDDLIRAVIKEKLLE